LDVATTSLDTSAACILFQQAGGFSTPFTTPLDRSPRGEFVAGNDLDDDGQSELFLLAANKQVVEKYLDIRRLDADGGLILVGSFDTRPYAKGILFADIDSDGLRDVVVAHTSNEIGIYRQLVGAGLANEDRYWFGNPEPGGRGPQSVAVGDLNGDGQPDIASVAISLFVLYHR
jgi:hypothetical protein